MTKHSKLTWQGSLVQPFEAVPCPLKSATTNAQEAGKGPSADFLACLQIVKSQENKAMMPNWFVLIADLLTEACNGPCNLDTFFFIRRICFAALVALRCPQNCILRGLGLNSAIAGRMKHDHTALTAFAAKVLKTKTCCKPAAMLWPQLMSNTWDQAFLDVRNDKTRATNCGKQKRLGTALPIALAPR